LKPRTARLARGGSPLRRAAPEPTSGTGAAVRATLLFGLAAGEACLSGFQWPIPVGLAVWPRIQI